MPVGGIEPHSVDSELFHRAETAARGYPSRGLVTSAVQVEVTHSTPGRTKGIAEGAAAVENQLPRNQSGESESFPLQEQVLEGPEIRPT